MSSWHFSTSGFNIRFPKTPPPPQMKTKIWKNVHQITSIFCILLSFGVISSCLWGLEAYIYIKCLWVLLTNVYWFRATGGYICGCGRPSNLVVLFLVLLYELYFQYNTVFETVVSVDKDGMLEYWASPKHDCKFPKSVSWKYKTDTDLFELAKVIFWYSLVNLQGSRKFRSFLSKISHLKKLLPWPEDVNKTKL